VPAVPVKPAAPVKEAAKPVPAAPVKETPKPAAPVKPAPAPKAIFPKKADLKGQKNAAASTAIEPPPALAKKPAVAKKDKPASKKSKALIFGGIGVVVVILAIVALVMSGSKKEQPAPAPEPDTAVESPAPVLPVTGTDKVPAVNAGPGTDATVADGQSATDVEPPPPAPVEPPPPATGSLSIQTTPIDAQVYINGELKGNSPIVINDLPEGPCTVEVRKTNYKSFTSTADVVGGQTEGLNSIVLEILSGKIDLSTEPSGVPYVITPDSPGAGAGDASLLSGVTPVTLDGFMPGSYRVSFERAGWKPYEQNVVVNPGETSGASFEYVPGVAHISSTPAGANVVAADNVLGVTPADLGDLPEGIFEASVQLDGYEPEYLKLDIPFGGSVSKDVSLLRLDRVIKRATELDVLPAHEGGNIISLPQNILAGNSGTVFIRFIINQEGLVESAELVTSGKVSSQAADFIVRTARAWTFSPGTRKGFPMRVEVVIPINIMAE
jgi:TonB family protein